MSSSIHSNLYPPTAIHQSWPDLKSLSFARVRIYPPKNWRMILRLDILRLFPSFEESILSTPASHRQQTKRRHGTWPISLFLAGVVLSRRSVEILRLPKTSRMIGGDHGWLASMERWKRWHPHNDFHSKQGKEEWSRYSSYGRTFFNIVRDRLNCCLGRRL